jgi:uncharacterized protein with HEPN domain
MADEINKWLTDIQQAIFEIDFFLPAKRDFNDFKKDLKTKRAIERNIGIIGEAINRLLQKQPYIAITSARKIVDTRNYIIHGYDSVSDEILWAIIIKDIPLLNKEVGALLGLST